MKSLLLKLALLAAVVLAGCTTDARVASENISKAADQFEVERRVVFYNGISGEYILSVEGRCSITKDNRDNQVEITCKTGDDAYKKHYLGLSDNVTYFAEQLKITNASTYRYRVIFKPTTIIPNIDIR